MSYSKCVLVSIKSFAFSVFIIQFCFAETIDSLQPEANNGSLIFAHVVSGILAWISKFIIDFVFKKNSISIYRFTVMVIVISKKFIQMIRTKMNNCIGLKDLAN